MTNPGVQIFPMASSREKKLLEAKYKIFREQIGIQRKWRDEMAAAAGDG
jgi:D-ribulokinase